MKVVYILSGYRCSDSLSVIKIYSSYDKALEGLLEQIASTAYDDSRMEIIIDELQNKKKLEHWEPVLFVYNLDDSERWSWRIYKDLIR